MKTKKILIVLAVILTLILTGCSSSKPADQSAKKTDFPKKNIDLTILFAAGTSADLGIRQLVDIVQKDFPQPIVCNNRTGGGGAVGYQYILSQPADGYNIVWNSTSISTSYYQGNLPKDKNYQSFRGVAGITAEPSAISVKADAKWKTLQEFLDDAKANPGQLKVVNAGVGSFNHLTSVALQEAAGVKFNDIFNNTNSMPLVLGGQADAVVNTVADVATYAKSGQVRVLGVIGNQRVEAVGDVPTVKEQGVDLELMMYRGIAVAKDTPDDVVKVLEDAFIKAAQSDTFQEYAKKNGVVINIMGSADFDKYMADNDAQMAVLMEKIGLKKQ